MMKKGFLLQGLKENEDHFKYVRDMIENPSDIEKCIISSAFMNASGADLLLDRLQPIKNCLKMYIGIRNGITSEQAFEKLAGVGIYPYYVDTATAAYIFHPKVYLTRYKNNTCTLIVGSANLTTGGLISNLEASILLQLDLSSSEDEGIYNQILEAFEALEATYDDNVILTDEETDYNKMVEQGLLIDESFVQPRITAKASGGKGRTELRKRMALPIRKIAKTAKKPKHYEETLVEGTEATAGLINKNLLWKSKPLSRRDLNIPTGAKTNITGSMFLNRGDASQNINFQHYFRDEVFADAKWSYDTDPKRRHYERAFIKFKVVMRGIDYGIFTLRISHNTNTSSAAYKQHNSMTQLHWGKDLKSLVGKDDLLNGIMYIYGPEPGADIYSLVFEEAENPGV